MDPLADTPSRMWPGSVVEEQHNLIEQEIGDFVVASQRFFQAPRLSAAEPITAMPSAEETEDPQIAFNAAAKVGNVVTLKFIWTKYIDEVTAGRASKPLDMSEALILASENKQIGAVRELIKNGAPLVSSATSLFFEGTRGLVA